MRPTAFLIVLLCVSPALAADYYLANQACDDGGPGSEGEPWCTVAHAAATLQPGDTVYLKAGTYEEELIPAASGTEQQPITYAAYGDGDAVLTGANPEYAIINLSGRSWIVLEGLVVTDTRGWVRAVDTHHVTLRGNTFSRATAEGTRGGIKFEGGTYNRILDNVIDDGNDNLLLIDSDHNLVQGNTFTKARHTLWAIKCGDYNVLRDNHFHNEIQKIGEVFDCEDLDVYDSTTHNLIEGNVFAYTAAAEDASPYSGIQYAGQKGIVRRNVFHSCTGPAIQVTLYSDEATFNTDNRFVHNVFHENHFGAVELSGSQSYEFGGQLFRNNALWRNDFVQHDFRWDWYDELAGQPVQVKTGRTDGFWFDTNVIADESPGDLYVIAYGQRDETTNPAPEPLSWWETEHPDLFSGNLEVDPAFVDAGNRDYELTAGSPLIDAGAWLTTAVGAGSGTALAVADAIPFCDGFGIEGVDGDRIQLEGQTERATVVSVDYAAGVLTLDQSLSWDDGSGVALAYEGDGPDIGAFEYGLAGDDDAGDDDAGDDDDDAADDDTSDDDIADDDGGAGGCGCTQTPGSAPVALGLLLLALGCRRRAPGPH